MLADVTVSGARRWLGATNEGEMTNPRRRLKPPRSSAPSGCAFEATPLVSALLDRAIERRVVLLVTQVVLQDYCGLCGAAWLGRSSRRAEWAIGKPD